MNYKKYLYAASPILLALAASAFANVPSPDEVTEVVAGPLAGVGVAAEFGAIGTFLAQKALPFLNVIAGVTIVIAGILAVIAQDENRINTTRNVVVSAIIAIVLVNGAHAIAKALWFEFGYEDGGGVGLGEEILTAEIFGLLSWIEQPMMIFALLTIVISGLRAVTTFGGEDGIGKLRSTIASVIFGIVLIVVKFVVSDVIVFQRTADQLNEIGINLTTTVLGYMGLFAVAVLVIAGLYMVANIGNDEQYTKAKALVVRVITGLVVIMVASALALLLVDTVIN